MPNYSQILITNFANKQWALNGESYDGLNWLDSSPKPTQAELDALCQSTQDTVAKDACKAKAKELLAQSDWSQMPDVGLKNSAEFVTYRGILRGLATQPQVNPDFPVEPTPVWS